MPGVKNFDHVCDFTSALWGRKSYLREFTKKIPEKDETPTDFGMSSHFRFLDHLAI
jgi:hypothetical protein